MKYYKKLDGIEIIGLEEFNIEHILLCGQVFRFYHNEKDDTWIVYSKDKKAIVKEYRQDNRAFIYTIDQDYFINYFDLNTSYKNIKEKLRSYNIDFLNKAIDCFYGIRILHQDIFETFFSFLISSNNNIKRIQGIIERMCDSIGTDKGDYKAFPDYVQLKNTTYQQFLDFGLGYRARYFEKTLQAMNDENTLQNLVNLSEDEIKKSLMNYCGVGEKVADCVMLFGYGCPSSFPVDVWIEKMYNTYFGNETNRHTISKNLVEIFGKLSGYAQQYLFFYIKNGLTNE